MENIFINIFDKTEFLNMKNIKPRYFPILSDINLFRLFFKNLKKRSIKNSNFWKTRTVSRPITATYDVDKIKSIKEKHNTAFPIVFASITLINLFKSLPDYISDLTICFINKSISNNFNNFGFIFFSVPKILDQDLMIKKISNLITRNKFMVPFSSFYINKLNFNHSYNNIDVLFSCIPLTKNDLYINNNKLINSYINLPYSSCPIYLYSTSYANNLDMTLHINTDMLDKSVLIDNLKIQCRNIKEHDNIL